MPGGYISTTLLCKIALFQLESNFKPCLVTSYITLARSIASGSKVFENVKFSTLCNNVINIGVKICMIFFNTEPLSTDIMEREGSIWQSTSPIIRHGYSIKVS